MPIRHRRLPAMIAVAALMLTACADDDAPSGGATLGTTLSVSTDTDDGDDDGDDDRDENGDDASAHFPEILAVVPSLGDDGRWSFEVTVSSPYDTPEQYADGWRVLGPDGAEYGTHTLTHDHANEQPFTRRQSGVEIPDDVTEVTIEGRDLVNGFGGPTQTVALDRG